MEYGRQQKGRLRFGVLVVLSLFLFFTLSPLLTRIVAADTPTYAGMNPQDKAKSYVLYYAMLTCFENVNSISNDDVIAGAVAGLNGNNSVRSWYLDKTIGDGGDGIVECGTAERAAVSLWGYASFDDMMIDFGYKNPGNGNDWTNSNPGADIASSLRGRVFSGSNPSLTPDARYLYFRGTLEAACEISSPVDYASAPSSMKSAADGSGTKYVKLTEPTADYKGTVDKIYTVGKWQDIVNMLFPLNTPSPPNDGHINCREVAKIASTNAGAYATWAVTHTDAAKAIDSTSAGAGGHGPKATSTCSAEIGGVGWIVCPVVNFLAKINDGMFEFVGEHFLRTNPQLFNTQNGTYIAWGVFRNYANVAFVIVFLIIIYSQVTGAGVNNYGIKRMLPRLIVAAILVNISYFICQAAIDLSNILGFSLQGLLHSIPATPAGEGKVPGFEKIIATILIGGAAIAGAIALLLALSTSVILACLLALGMIVLILVIREAAIVMLVVISPLAFVAYLLPNTEGWYKKWFKMFTTLLLVFPIIAVVFGASDLAGRIINAAAGSAGGKDTIILQLTAIGMAAIPLFVVPGILKGAVGATGALGSKLQGYGNKATSRVSSGAKKNVADSKLGQFNQYRQQQSRIRNAKRLGGVDPRKGGGVNPLNWGARANRGINNSRLSGAFGQNAANSGAEIERQEFEKNVKAAEATNEALSSSAIEAMAMTGKTKDGKALDSAVHTAAVRKLMKDGNHEQRMQMVGQSGNIANERVRESIRDGAYAKGMNAYLGGGIGDAIMSGAITSQAKVDEQIVDTANKGKLTADGLVSDGTAINRIKAVLEASRSGTAQTVDLGGGVIHTTSVAPGAVTATALNQAGKAARDAAVLPATKGRIAGNMAGSVTTMGTY